MPMLHENRTMNLPTGQAGLDYIECAIGINPSVLLEDEAAILFWKV